MMKKLLEELGAILRENWGWFLFCAMLVFFTLMDKL